ncbi:MAG: C4-dicarboxylate ABC transporter [Chloroflexi bacterium UTCFX4]|nr:MAG: C4-dicarboxylate ABC transporter [Chloroflexi bacterium UTCFX4]
MKIFDIVSAWVARPLSAPVRERIRDLSPAYFALVMATGIISIAADVMGLRLIAVGLLGLNIFAYVVLWILTALRVIWFPRQFLQDLTDHHRGPDFLTTTAGTCVLGSQFIRITGDYGVATILWTFGILLWAGFNYAVFAALTVKKTKPSLGEGIAGAWLIGVVAAQSIAVLSTISLIFYRYTFFKFAPGDLTPPYWIDMGAMAISAFAGTLLIGNAPDAALLQALLPFLKGFTIFYWATGTWWIPMLVILTIWQYLVKEFPLTYNPLDWGAVFPLGMYTVATLGVAQTLDLEFLNFIPHYFIYIALLAWFAALLGLLRRLRRLDRFPI